MVIRRPIPIANIRVDRIPFKGVLSLVDHLKSGGTVPPIHVLKTENGFQILDGRHRWAAHKLLGRTEILARYGVRNL